MRVAAAFIALVITAALLWGIPALILAHEHVMLHVLLDAEIRHPWLQLVMKLAWLPLLIAGVWVRARKRLKWHS